ncbi:MAG: NAD(P)-dependent oxidoreductase [Parachlamydiales bacterium]|nr:NAD(P)-dependent oxidoreductase [Parachlamydiales bacterium]
MKIVVFGGSGQIGYPLVDKLSKEHQVTVIHRTPKYEMSLMGVRQIIADVSKVSPELWQNLKELHPDVIVHLLANNEFRAKQFVDNCKDLCRKVVVLSSCEIYSAFACYLKDTDGPIEPSPIKESDQTRRYIDRNFVSSDIYKKLTSSNGYSCLEAEINLFTQNHFQCTILRAAPLFGPSPSTLQFCSFFCRDDNHKDFCINEKFLTCMSDITFIDNLVEGIRWAIFENTPENVIYNLSSLKKFSFVELLQIIAKELDWKGCIGLSQSLELDFNLNQSIALDMTKICQAGYKELYSVEEAVKKTLKYEKTQYLFLKTEDNNFKIPDDVVWYKLQTMTKSTIFNKH